MHLREGYDDIRSQLFYVPSRISIPTEAAPGLDLGMPLRVAEVRVLYRAKACPDMAQDLGFQGHIRKIRTQFHIPSIC